MPPSSPALSESLSRCLEVELLVRTVPGERRTAPLKKATDVGGRSPNGISPRGKRERLRGTPRDLAHDENGLLTRAIARRQSSRTRLISRLAHRSLQRLLHKRDVDLIDPTRIARSVRCVKNTIRIDTIKELVARAERLRPERAGDGGMRTVPPPGCAGRRAETRIMETKARAAAHRSSGRRARPEGRTAARRCPMRLR